MFSVVELETWKQLDVKGREGEALLTALKYVRDHHRSVVMVARIPAKENGTVKVIARVSYSGRSREYSIHYND